MPSNTNTSSERDRKVGFYLQHIQGGNNSAKNGSNLASHHPTCSQMPILLTHSPIHVPCVFFTPTYLIANFDPSRPRSKWQRGKSCDLQLGPRFPPVAQPIRVPGCGLLLSLRLGQGTWGCSSTLAVQRPTCNVRIATTSTSSFSWITPLPWAPAATTTNSSSVRYSLTLLPPSE